ncbi:MAG TPA: KpsF/GutQ family sugar-phosphate isomerase [Amaricoccus sp.]|uniref:KpsF/GutQ family sugar-phosphate isomerase n=1 Tax=Amaricoccus sp. TaxID=1872485 RepID=UPI002CC8582B|nr:KpsF/GutQ family sugar-phosphate isomerase [Amaricoccus sp.]HMQ95061.1 KpsF/GutQ family sugar-phosphate isomerase [Amaricoccus sp.]HMR50918.1 KpsF/GutQ family sugar-phosphate isomerase [Amaricoccus sp.]HMR58911.1 KpsF/GutQ family sugar-phosphate isomerase [Amaricoccus sp.]HMT97903.1 KpsF/GutQ family sugar-phosphate isomerase [Amaricoccus sp.]
MQSTPAPPDPLQLVATGRRVIAIEAEALASLGSALDESFARAVARMLDAKGRVIVSGIGKSGHVARKIAATLASTGTPALFVHPAEASHGDLGMITRDDVVLLLSNSGETAELADLIAYARRFGIPLIGLAGRADSTLIRQSDIGLVLPPATEACPVGLAPTTSTTMALALGDALAVALMEHRAFTPEDFRGLHPGGRLGARLATVEHLMHSGPEVPLVAPETPMTEALLEMSRRGFGVVGVVDAAGALVGIVTDGDLRRNMDGLLGKRVADVMTHQPRTIRTTALASEALGIMNTRKITSLFATTPEAPERPAGILHVHDCLRAGVV